MANTIGRFIEAKIMKESLHEVNERVNRLVGVVAHDLKNPLGNIISLSSMIEEDTTEDETKEVIRLIKMTSKNSMEMISSTLDMSAIESGKIKINKGDSAILKLVQDSWELVKHLAMRKNISIKIQGDDIKISLDNERMKQTLCNLFTNAIKFSNKGSLVKVSWTLFEKSISLEIKDTGVGMSAEQKKHIFDPSKTTSTIGTNGETGTGYGLPLVAKIIDFHDGAITVESSENLGSTFFITLPL